MRILFASAHKYLPELRGGMEINTDQLITRLLRRGVEAGVLAGLHGAGLIGLSANFQTKLFRKKYSRHFGNGYPVWRAIDSHEAVEYVISAFRPDIVVVQGGHRFVPLVRAALELRLPVIGYVHSPDKLLLDREVLNDKKFALLANSDFTASLYPDVKMAAVIPPIIPRELYFTETDRSTATFVNPSVHKGLRVVLDLVMARPDVTFLFVQNSFDISQKSGLPSNVQVVGPFVDMRDVYKRARLVLAPSQWDETWGRIATEAHISGIPVLGSISGGLPEAIGPGGLCLPREAAATEWRAAFGSIWDDPIKYSALADSAREYSLRPALDPDNLVDLFMQVVDRLVL